MARDGIFRRLFGRARKWLTSFRKPDAQPVPPVEAAMPEDISPDLLPEMKMPDVPVLKDNPPDIATQEAGAPHLASRLEFPQSDKAPPPTDILPDRSAQVRKESQARTEARIGIRNAQKRGDTEAADSMRAQESQRRKSDTSDAVLQNIADRAMAGGQTVVMPDEIRNDAPSPFTWTPSPGQTSPTESAFPGAPRMSSGGLNLPPTEWQRIQQQAQQVMPPSQGADSPSVMFPKQNHSQELLSVLKEMAESLKSIDGKLPQRATYSE